MGLRWLEFVFWRNIAPKSYPCIVKILKNLENTFLYACQVEILGSRIRRWTWIQIVSLFHHSFRITITSSILNLFIRIVVVCPDPSLFRYCPYSEVSNNRTGSNKHRGWMYHQDLIIIWGQIIVGGILPKKKKFI